MAHDKEYLELQKALKGDDYEAPDAGIPGQTFEVEEELEEESDPSEQNERFERQSANLEKTLQALQESVKSQGVSPADSRLLADPNIRNYLAAKERGENVELVPAVSKAEQPAREEVPPPDLETMTNAQLASYMKQTIGSAVSSAVSEIVGKEVTKLRGELKPQVDQAAAAAQSQISERISQQIVAVKSKYSDFDQIQPFMIELNKTVKGLSVEELYHMAKIRAGVPPVTQQQLETERPQRPTGQRKRPLPPVGQTRTRQGLSNLVRSVLDNRFGTE